VNQNNGGKWSFAVGQVGVQFQAFLTNDRILNIGARFSGSLPVEGQNEDKADDDVLSKAA
jgi:hypothetical protein